MCPPTPYTVTGMEVIEFQSIIGGDAQGELMVLTHPLSFWGGTDAKGVIVDPHHPACGQSIAGAVIAMPPAKGSTAGPGALVELLVNCAGPNAILLSEPDMVAVVASKVAAAIGVRPIPVGILTPGAWECALEASTRATAPLWARIEGNRCRF